MNKEIKFTNGWTAEYDHDGKWLLYDNSPEQLVKGFSYLDELVKRFNLVRITK